MIAATRVVVGTGRIGLALALSVGSAGADEPPVDLASTSALPCDDDDGVRVSPVGFSFDDGRFAGVRVSDLDADCRVGDLSVEVLGASDSVLRRSPPLDVDDSTVVFRFDTRLDALAAHSVRVMLAGDSGTPSPGGASDGRDEPDDEVGNASDPGTSLPGTGGGSFPVAETGLLALGLGVLLAAASRRGRR